MADMRPPPKSMEVPQALQQPMGPEVPPELFPLFEKVVTGKASEGEKNFLKDEMNRIKLQTMTKAKGLMDQTMEQAQGMAQDAGQQLQGAEQKLGGLLDQAKQQAAPVMEQASGMVEQAKGGLMDLGAKFGLFEPSQNMKAPPPSRQSEQEYVSQGEMATAMEEARPETERLMGNMQMEMARQGVDQLPEKEQIEWVMDYMQKHSQ